VEAGVELAEEESLPEMSNGDWPKPPAGCAELDEVSDLMASSADDAAPRANSMAELRQLPRGAAHTIMPMDQQTPCHGEKPNKT
jgi:hypothetical protein